MAMIIDCTGKRGRIIFQSNIELSENEKQAYIDYVQDKQPFSTLEELKVVMDGEFVDLYWKFEGMPFERIRRITGYLVGTKDNWNDAKSSEEADRVKHSLMEEIEDGSSYEVSRSEE